MIKSKLTQCPCSLQYSLCSKHSCLSGTKLGFFVIQAGGGRGQRRESLPASPSRLKPTHLLRTDFSHSLIDSLFLSKPIHITNVKFYFPQNKIIANSTCKLLLPPPPASVAWIACMPFFCVAQMWKLFLAAQFYLARIGMLGTQATLSIMSAFHQPIICHKCTSYMTCRCFQYCTFTVHTCTCMEASFLLQIFCTVGWKYRCTGRSEILSVVVRYRMMKNALHQFFFNQELYVIFFLSHSTWKKVLSKTQILMTHLIIAEWRSPWTKWAFQRKRRQIFLKWLLLYFMLETLLLRTVETLKVCGKFTCRRFCDSNYM